jgi:hypothetical protein
MHADKYNKLLTENITKTYKVAQDGTVDKINHELKNIANELNIGNRMEPVTQPQAFISLKDHKDGFEYHPKCRLINPAKSDLGKVSKTILDTKSMLKSADKLVQTSGETLRTQHLV